MFTAELFKIAKTLKQPTCPSTEEWIKKMQYTHAHTHTHTHTAKMEYYSAIKRNNNGICNNTDGSQITILNKVTQRKKVSHHLHVEFNKNKLIYTTETNSKDLKIKLWL